MINKIGFISYTVSNLQQSINFYQNLLGLELLLKDDRWAEFNISGQRFAIHEKTNGAIMHDQSAAIVYFEANPIETIVKNLQEKGVKFSGEVKVPGAVVTFPSESILPKAIVNPFALFKSLTLSKVGMLANDCKFFKSASSAPPGPALVTCGAPLNLTMSPADL